ncbi:acyl-CoA thioester hydrolase [Ruaniaceae bacterium KH17]|nr:acyl-CoA thioester hydrolase [Ruaniaceae bacterium KH17]
MKTTVPVPVRWADLDAYGHVNNAAVFTLLEEARIALFWRGREDAATQLATFIAHQEIEYLLPISYPDEPLPISVWISKIGGASAEVCYEVPNAAGDVAARARTTIVTVNPATGTPRRITDEERARWAEYLADPVQFRRH